MFKETEWSHFYKNLKYAPSIDANRTLYDALLECAKKHPKRIAIEFASRKYTFEDLITMVKQAACFLDSLGIKKGDKIIVCSSGLPSTEIMLYACSVIGVVPSIFSGEYKSRLFLEYAVLDEYKHIILTDRQLQNYAPIFAKTELTNIIVAKPSDFLGEFKTFVAHAQGLIKRLNYVADMSLVPPEVQVHFWNEVSKTKISESRILELKEKVNSNDACLTVLENNTLKKKSFTSYNSFALLTQVNMLGFLFEDTTDDSKVMRHLSYIDLMYSVGFILGVNAVLLYGHTLCLKSWCDDTDLIRQFHYYKPNVVLAFPTVLNEFTDSESIYSSRITYLNKIILFGFPLNGVEYNRHYSFFERYAPGVRYEKVYGVSEVASIYCYNPPELENNHILGIPIPGTRVKVFDENANELPVGKQGRLCVSTPASAIFTEDDISTSVKRQLRDERSWVFTGTLGHIDENKYIYFDGSITRKFDINGHYFYPYILENEILQISGVMDCLVFVYGNGHIVAAVVPEEEFFFDNDKLLELKATIEHQTQMAHHHGMRQDSIEFLVSLPKTSRGDNDYVTFEKQYEERLQLLEDISADET